MTIWPQFVLTQSQYTHTLVPHQKKKSKTAAEILVLKGGVFRSATAAGGNRKCHARRTHLARRARPRWIRDDEKCVKEAFWRTLGRSQPRNLSPALEARLMAMSKVPQS